MSRRNRPLVPLVALLTLAAGGCAAGGAAGGGAGSGTPELTVLTLNIWHNQQGWDARLGEIVEGIRALDPDVIGLQEVLQNDSLPNQAHTIAAALDYEVHFTSVDPPGSVKRYGNAILTRDPVVERGERLLQPPNDYRNITHVRINVGGVHVDIYNTHLHHTAEGGEMRRTQILDALDFVDATRGDGPLILMGDFNAPVAAPEMAPVRDRFDDALARLRPDLADSVSTLNTAKGHTPRRIDHIFYGQGPEVSLRPRSADVVLDAPSAAGVWPSDHFGVIATFAVPDAVPMSALRETSSARNVEELLVGRFPGVRVVTLPGGGFSVRVWGPHTVNASSEPLYVVDGMPVQVDPRRGLYWLNVHDIDSIQVLKDIAETAAWGVRGANGVVVITTRRGDSGPD